MKPLDYFTIGQKIKKRRLEHGWSQEKTSELCGISPSFYGNIERGTKIMSLETFVNICHILQISPDYVLSDEVADIDTTTLNIINEVKKSGSLQYKRYIRIIKALAEISDKL